MSKIKLKTTLVVTGTDNDTFEYELEGIKIDNKLKFKEDTTFVTLTILNDAITIQRKTDEYILDMQFGDTNTCNYHLNGLGNLNLELLTKKVEISDKRIKIVYDMNGNSYTYLVNYEVKSWEKN